MYKTENIKKVINNNWMFIFPFVGFFILLRISPMMYDGWFGANYYNNQGGLIKWIVYMGSYYNGINGRVASTFFSGILESFPSEILYDSASTLVMTMICWCLCEVFKINNVNKKLLVAIFYYSLILFMPSQMRSYVIQIANSAYVPPVLFCLLFFLVSRKYLEKPKDAPRWMLWTLCFLAFCISTWIESDAMGFGITLGLSLLYLTYHKRRIFWYLWIAIGVAFFSGLLMMLSPGLRMSRTVLVGDSEIVGVFFNNIKNLYKFLFYDNNVMFITFCLLFAFIVAQKGWEGKIKYKVLSIAFLILATLLFVYNLNKNMINNYYINEYYNVAYYGIINNNVLSIFAMLFLVSLSIYGFLLFEGRAPLVLLVVMAGSSLLPICFTPNFSSRVASIGFFMGLCICVGLLAEVDLSKNTWRQKTIIIGVIFLGILALDKEILLCRRIYSITMQREMLINEVIIRQKLDEWDFNNDVLRLPVYQDGDVTTRGVAFEGSFHYPYFLSHYNLADRTRVIFTNSDYYLVSVEQSGSFITLHVDNNLDLLEDEKFYFVFRNGSDQEIFNSGKAVDNLWTVGCPEGLFEIKTYLVHMADDGGSINSMELIDQPVFMNCK